MYFKVHCLSQILESIFWTVYWYLLLEVSECFNNYEIKAEMNTDCILIFVGLPVNFGFCNWRCRINISGHYYYYYYYHHHHHQIWKIYFGLIIVQCNFLKQTATPGCEGFLTFLELMTRCTSQGTVGHLVISFGASKPPAHHEDGDRVSSRITGKTSHSDAAVWLRKFHWIVSLQKLKNLTIVVLMNVSKKF